MDEGLEKLRLHCNEYKTKSVTLLMCGGITFIFCSRLMFLPFCMFKIIKWQQEGYHNFLQVEVHISPPSLSLSQCWQAPEIFLTTFQKWLAIVCFSLAKRQGLAQGHPPDFVPKTKLELIVSCFLVWFLNHYTKPALSISSYHIHLINIIYFLKIVNFFSLFPLNHRIRNILAFI